MADVVWQNVDGWVYSWNFQGTLLLNAPFWHYGPKSTTGWRTASVGDFNGDMKNEFLLQNRDGRTAIKYLWIDGFQPFRKVPPGWNIVAPK